MSNDSNIMDFLQTKSLGPKRAFEPDSFSFKKPQNTKNKKPWNPKTPKDLFRNKELIKSLKNRLKNSKKSQEDETIQCLIIRGPIGCGKTELLNVILKDSGYNVTEYDQEFSQADFSDLKKSIVSSGIESILGITTSRAIIIKNYDNNLKHTQYSELLKFISTSDKITPIFFTSHNLSSSASRSVPKNIDEFLFELPHITTLVELGIKILLEKGKDDAVISNYSLNKIAKQCNGDIRYFVNSVKRLDSQNTANTFISKDINYGIKERLEKISDDKLSLLDKTLLSNMHTNSVVQENYINFIIENTKNSKNKTDKDTLLNNICTISDYITSGNILLTYINKNIYFDDSSLVAASRITGTIAPLKLVKEGLTGNKKNKFKTITYSPNYRMSIDLSLTLLDQLSFILSKIVDKPNNAPNELKKQNLEIFIRYLYKTYDITDSNLRIICKLANMDGCCKVKFTQLRTILKNETKKQ
jgi:hypothetical protein